jgi:hypothetical protein
MFSMKDFPFAVLVLLWSLRIISAIPTWEPIYNYNQETLGTLHNGGAKIEAQAPNSFYGQKHLALDIPGKPSNVTIKTHHGHPPVFYVYQRQLWLMKNETTVWPVNVYNTTGIFPLPMQLRVAEKQEGIAGRWWWEGQTLNFDANGRSSVESRLFYVCFTNQNDWNVFLNNKSEPTPEGCEITSLHTFTTKRR